MLDPALGSPLEERYVHAEARPKDDKGYLTIRAQPGKDKAYQHI